MCNSWTPRNVSTICLFNEGWVFFSLWRWETTASTLHIILHEKNFQDYLPGTKLCAVVRIDISHLPIPILYIPCVLCNSFNFYQMIKMHLDVLRVPVREACVCVCHICCTCSHSVTNRLANAFDEWTSGIPSGSHLKYWKQSRLNKYGVTLIAHNNNHEPVWKKKYSIIIIVWKFIAFSRRLFTFSLWQFASPAQACFLFLFFFFSPTTNVALTISGHVHFISLLLRHRHN